MKTVAYFYGQPQPSHMAHGMRPLGSPTHAHAQHTPLCKLLTKIYIYIYTDIYGEYMVYFMCGRA